MQKSGIALEIGKTRARHLRRTIHVDHIELLTEIQMILWFKIKLRRLTEGADEFVACFVFPRWHILAQDVRITLKLLGKLGLNLGQLCLLLFHLIFDGLSFLNQSLTFIRGSDGRDASRDSIAPGAQNLNRLDQPPTFLV